MKTLILKLLELERKIRACEELCKLVGEKAKIIETTKEVSK